MLLLCRSSASVVTPRCCGNPMLELVPDCGTQQQDDGNDRPEADTRPSATIHYIYDPRNPSINAIVSVARRLQEVLIEHGGLPEGGALPFPALAPTADR